MTTRRFAVGLGLALVVLGCGPRPDAPPGVRALRHQRRRDTIVLPVWDMDVAEEVATNTERYAGKTLVIQRAYLNPERDITLGKRTATLPLRGGGIVTLPVERVPEWLRKWTGAPLTVTASVHPPRPSAEGAGNGPLLNATAIDFAHPLELASVSVERTKDAAWLTAHIENYRGEAARATLEVRFGGTRHVVQVGPVEPGQRAVQRLLLFDKEPRWREFAAEARRLWLRFADGSAVSVDIGKWLEDPAETLLDWGYTFTPPANAVLVLSVDRPEAELERFAALELRSYFAQFTDANIEPREPTAADPLPERLPLIVVGTARHNALAAAIIGEAKLAGRLKALGAEGYVLKSLQHGGRPTLLVAANTPRGLMHGVYGLLEHYGVRFSMHGARLPGRGKFRLIAVDEAQTPIFPVRRLVAMGRKPHGGSRWTQYRWITLFDLAAKNRYNEVVFPLDGLDTTFTYTPGRSRDAVFPFDVGPYSCVAEAYLAHQRGLGVLADYARRRGLILTFARRAADNALRVAASPACVAAAVPLRDVGRRIAMLEDAGDRFAMPRVEEAAEAGAELLRKKNPVLAVPYSRGSRARASFLAKLAWDRNLTPKAYYRGWAATLTHGEAADQLADAVLAVDRLDADLLAALPEPLGTGPPLATPVREADLASQWAKLKARATRPAAVQQREALKAQIQKLREIGRKLEPIHATVRKALGSALPLWEDPLFESAAAAGRAQRIISAFYRFRGLLGGLASAQEGALAYYAALAEPEQALPRLLVAAAKYETAQRLVMNVARRARDTSYGPVFSRLVGQLAEQHRWLTEWLGPLQDASAVARLRVQGSDAVIHLFRRDRTDIYAAYKLAGREVVQLRLRASSARIVRRGEAPRTIQAEGGVFLISLDTVPTYIIALRAGWPGPSSR